MRLHLLAAAAAVVVAVLAVPSLAAAQLSNRAISVESGLSAPLRARGPAAATFAISASRWLERLDAGDVEGVLRVALGVAPETGGRGADGALAATAGLRLSLGSAPLRPQLFVDFGWSRGGGEAASDRVAFGLGAGLEWFPVPDLSVSARAAIRGAGADAAAEGLLALAAYF